VKQAAGFSLIELVVVIVIAAILAAIAIPRLTDSESKATWYHEQVLAAVRYAQRQAVAQRRPIFVCVLAAEVRLGYDAACATSLAAPGQQTNSLVAPGGVTIAASATPFSFNSLGQPSPIGGVTVTLAGRSVNVTAETGYVY